jgi:hypothetical protein
VAHGNGLGQTYYDCYQQGTWSRVTAGSASAAWNAGPVTPYEVVPSCFLDCLGWQTGTSCAVWCYGRNSLAGRVGLNAVNNDCNAACPSQASAAWGVAP